MHRLDRTKKLENYLANADIYLSTSLWEGLPLSVLEAMSIGLPVVLSDCVGNRDLVEDNGFLYRNKKECIISIEKLSNNEKLCDSQGKYSKKFFKENFNLKNMATNYLNLYNKLNLF